MAHATKKGIGIRTWPTEAIPLSRLKAAPYNPRQITASAKRGLNSSLQRWGLVQPIVFNKQTGRVVGGHQRLQLLTEAGAKSADCIVVDLPPIEEKALNVALNNPNLQGEFTAHLEALASEIRTELPELPKDLGLDRLLSDLLTSLPVDDDAADSENAAASAPSPASESPSDTTATIGEYRFDIERDVYERWKESLRQQVGFEKAAILAEVKRRLGL